MNEEKRDCGYTEDYCRRGYGCVVLIAALVSLTASLTALALCGAKDGHNDVGNGWAIGILGTLLTFAVAWNIWQVIDTKNTVRKAEESSKKLKKLEQSLETQRNLFNQHNLEIRHLIDAHAKLLEADRTEDLASRYYAYGEAIDFLLQSKVDLSYEQFERARHGLFSTFNQLESTQKREEISNFLAREREFDWLYQRLMSMLESKAEDITRLRKQLTHIRDYRRDSLAEIRKKYPD